MSDGKDELPYQMIPLSQIKAGMILGQNVLDKEGRIIIAQGARLTPIATPNTG